MKVRFLDKSSSKSEHNNEILDNKSPPIEQELPLIEHEEDWLSAPEFAEEDGDEADDEEDIDLEGNEEIKILQKQYQELQYSLDTAIENIRVTGELIKKAKQIEAKEKTPIHLSNLEEKHKFLQDSSLDLTESVKDLGDLIRKKILDIREKYTYESENEESEIENEESEIENEEFVNMQQEICFAAELRSPAEEIDYNSWEIIPAPGVLIRSETYFSIEEPSKFEKEPAAEDSMESHPLVRSHESSFEEWNVILNVVPAAPALDQTFRLSELDDSTTEQETTDEYSDSSLFEYESSQGYDSDSSSLAVNDNAITPSKIEMVPIQIFGDREDLSD